MLVIFGNLPAKGKTRHGNQMKVEDKWDGSEKWGDRVKCRVERKTNLTSTNFSTQAIGSGV